ncbi:unnamed protein product, partial [Ectocarpus sp. 12 AP-2014]
HLSHSRYLPHLPSAALTSPQITLPCKLSENQLSNHSVNALTRIQDHSYGFNIWRSGGICVRLVGYHRFGGRVVVKQLEEGQQEEGGGQEPGDCEVG